MCLANLILILPTISALYGHTYSSIELRQLQSTVMHDICLKIQAAGAFKIIRDLRINRKQIKTSTKTRPRNQLNMDNLINVTITQNWQ